MSTRLKRYLAESPGGVMGAIWTDVNPVNSQAQERMGYPTQKPVALMTRIIEASSNPESLVLDPFCGCGTTIEAAQGLGRQWIGIDVTHHAIEVIEGRLDRRCPGAYYTVKGRPEDLESAAKLACDQPYEFQWWTNWLLGVQNYLEYKKGSDRGIDGIIYFRNGPWGVGKTIVSVKGGQNISPEMISALSATVERERAQLGVFACLTKPTKRMRQEAAAYGIEKTAQGSFQRIQIVTVEELLNGQNPQMPAPIETEAFRQPLRPTRAQKVQKPDEQLSLPLPITGAGKARGNIEEHFSGRILAEISVG